MFGGHAIHGIHDAAADAFGVGRENRDQRGNITVRIMWVEFRPTCGEALGELARLLRCHRLFDVDSGNHLLADHLWQEIGIEAYLPIRVQFLDRQRQFAGQWPRKLLKGRFWVYWREIGRHSRPP